MQVRLDHARRIGHPVPLSEVAEQAGVDRMALTRLEAGVTKRFDGDMIARLCKYYGVEIQDLLEYDPEGILTHGLAPVVMSSL